MKNIRKKIHHWAKTVAASLPVVHADTAPFRAVGVDLTPLEEHVPNIVMREEQVEIYVYSDIAVVEATFWLQNNGKATEISVGFPCLGRESRFKPHDSGLADFAAFVNGKPVTVLSRNLDNEYYPVWYVWTQSFPKYAESCVKVRYHTVLFHYAHVSRIPFTYVLRTGRFWKGHIGKACITVHARGIPLTAIQEATPPGFVIDEQQNTLSWTFENLYPEDDIGLLLSPSIIQGDAVGMVVDDVLRINESRPPTNTAVVVGGRICGGDGFDCNVYELREGKHNTSKNGFTAFTYSERRQDHNITVPDRIAEFDKTNPLISLPVVFDAHIPITEVDVPVLHYGMSKYFLRGTVEYDAHGQLYLYAHEVMVVRYEKTDQSPWASDFPWVSSPSASFDVYKTDEFDYTNSEKRTQTQWVSRSPRRERSTVEHKSRWETKR